MYVKSVIIITLISWMKEKLKFFQWGQLTNNIKRCTCNKLWKILGASDHWEREKKIQMVISAEWVTPDLKQHNVSNVAPVMKRTSCPIHTKAKTWLKAV